MNNISISNSNFGLNKQNKVSFKNSSSLNLALPKGYKAANWFVSTQEKTGGLSHIRFIQDTTTNWIPKIFYSRSKADFAEFTFLEFSESALFYYAPALLGEKFLRPLYSKMLPEKLKKHVATPAKELLKSKALNGTDKRKVLAVKAAIVLGCAMIPLAEYTLSFAKNLFTLKVFDKADFSSVIGFNKDKEADKKAKEKVEKHSKEQITQSAVIGLTCLAASAGLAKFGARNNALQALSKLILQPGTHLYKGVEKLGVKSKGLKKALGKYFSFDFDKTADGKLCLSIGQLTASVLSGLYGYLEAAKDRGRLDYLENATRVPLVAAYTIFGSSALERGFIKFLHNKKGYSELINKDLKVVKLDKLKDLARDLFKKHHKTEQAKFKELLKKKTVITGIPFGLGLVVMGFSLAALNYYWTRYRFNKGVGQENSKIE